MFLAEFFFLQSLPGNRGSYLFIDYFVILGGSHHGTMTLSTILSNPLGDDEREVETLKECRNPSAIGIPNMFLGKIVPIPIFVAERCCFPKNAMKFPGLFFFSFVFERKIPGTAVSKIKMVEHHVTEKEKRTTACASKVPFSGFVHLRLLICQETSKIGLSKKTPR